MLLYLYSCLFYIGQILNKFRSFNFQFHQIIYEKTENIQLEKLSDLQKEHMLIQTKIVNLFNELEKLIFTKDYAFICQIHFYYYSFFKFKFTFNKENNYASKLFNVKL